MSRALELWRELNVLAETDAEAARFVNTYRVRRDEIERLRVEMSRHRSVDFRLGALYAIDSVTAILAKGDRHV